MPSWIHAEGVLVGPDGNELFHPNYQRKPVVISVEDGFHGEVRWDGLEGAVVSQFQLRLLEAVFVTSEPWTIAMPDNKSTIGVRLDILGKSERKISKEN